MLDARVEPGTSNLEPRTQNFPDRAHLAQSRTRGAEGARAGHRGRARGRRRTTTDPDVVIVGAGASGAAVAWSLARGRLQRRLPGAGRLGRPARAAALAAPTGSSTASPTSTPTRTCAGCAEDYPVNERRLDLQPADVQRRRRQHDPLERPLPALPPLGLPRPLARRRRRRLAADLRRAGAVLRPERPHDRRRRPDRRPVPAAALAAPDAADPARPARRDDGARLRPPRLALVAVRQRDHHRADYDGRPACNNCGPCDLGCPTGARSSADVTYWPLALRLGVELRTRCRVREITVDAHGRARGVALLRRRRARSRSSARRWSSSPRNGVGTPRLLLNSRSRALPGRPRQPERAGRQEPDVPPLRRRRSGIFAEPLESYKGPIGCSIFSHEFYETDRVARLRARLSVAGRPASPGRSATALGGVDGDARALGRGAPRRVRRAVRPRRQHRRDGRGPARRRSTR